MSTQPKPRLTPEQYLEMERKAEFRSEFHDGEMFAMSGASTAHNLILVNLISALRQRLRGSGCRLMASDMRVHVPSTSLYTYPDASVVCGEMRFADAMSDTLLNPKVLFEILSQTTEAYDRGAKFENYRSIDSLCGYVLISQDRAHVEVFVKADQKWSLMEATGLHSTIELGPLGLSLPLAEIYEEMDLP